MDREKYIIKDFHMRPPFSSFLPGIAGAEGVPLWAFYVNRGQGIASFGIEDKNHAIMEFSPAVIAYEDTARKGFRTFLKVNGSCFELFSSNESNEIQQMEIEPNSLCIKTQHKLTGLSMTVKYFLLPNQPFGALIRKVTIQNESPNQKSIEMLDGIARILPYGVSNSEFKEQANLLKSYGVIKNLQDDVPVFRVRASVEDSEEVADVRGGYFYASLMDGKFAAPVCDPNRVFGQDTGLHQPQYFQQHSILDLKENQHPDNKIPCAFSPFSFVLKGQESKTLYTMIGYTNDESKISGYKEWMKDENWWLCKEKEAQSLIGDLTKDIETHSGNQIYDQYLKQCYLDNLLRGGYPYQFSVQEGEPCTLHLFSRKHGDLERDYNFFKTEAVFYSQGNGNFRDVCQNRRDEIIFHPEIGDFDVVTFVNLIQPDGYNPLEIHPTKFYLKEGHLKYIDPILKKCQIRNEKLTEQLIKELENGVTPGAIFRLFDKYNGSSEGRFEEILKNIIIHCHQEQQAIYKEGYWSDHFTYVLDLVCNYLEIYPERLTTFLFQECKYKFYDSPARVLPRRQKYCLKDGRIYQYGATVIDERKNRDVKASCWMKTKQGQVLYVTLFEKLLLLCAIKCATLDPFQSGLEMEAGKPGWNDAFNGLPGMIGSSTSEVLDLKHLADHLYNDLNCVQTELKLSAQIWNYCKKLDQLVKDRNERYISKFDFWDGCSNLREDWREETRFHLDANRESVKAEAVKEFLNHLRELLAPITKLHETMILPTYYICHGTKFEKMLDRDGSEKLTPYGLPAVRVLAFEQEVLPPFLEAPAKQMKHLKPEEAEQLYQEIRSSDLFDQKLKMYKTSGSIEDVSMEVGRIRSFTPGWFERESIFLHMQYKYLLSLLEAGLYERYFDEIPKLLVPYMDDAVYGRSTLENSSFIASSANPDPNVHGRGYIARLSGSTAEVITMWKKTFVGATMFHVRNKTLTFTFAPILAGEMFDENGMIRFTLFDCIIIYQNKHRKATFGEGHAVIKSITIDGEETLEGNSITGVLAHKFRNKEFEKIDVVFE